jgi:hypothetical protein
MTVKTYAQVVRDAVSPQCSPRGVAVSPRGSRWLARRAAAYTAPLDAMWGRAVGDARAQRGKRRLQTQGEKLGRVPEDDARAASRAEEGGEARLRDSAATLRAAYAHFLAFPAPNASAAAAVAGGRRALQQREDVREDVRVVVVVPPIFGRASGEEGRREGSDLPNDLRRAFCTSHGCNCQGPEDGAFLRFRICFCECSKGQRAIPKSVSWLFL